MRKIHYHGRTRARVVYTTLERNILSYIGPGVGKEELFKRSKPWQLKDQDMEACYEYLGCDKTDCIMHGRKNGQYCWKLEGTLSNHYGIELARQELGGKKADACARSACIYFTAAKSRNLV